LVKLFRQPTQFQSLLHLRHLRAQGHGFSFTASSCRAHFVQLPLVNCAASEEKEEVLPRTASHPRSLRHPPSSSHRSSRMNCETL